MTNIFKSKQNPPLVFVLIFLFLLTLFVFIRRFFIKKNSSLSHPLSTEEISKIPLENFEASLVCLPPDNQPPCTYGLLYDKKKYSISGLSQSSLTVAGFQHGQVLTISGRIESDQIYIDSISGN